MESMTDKKRFDFIFDYDFLVKTWKIADEEGPMMIDEIKRKIEYEKNI